MKAIIGVRMVNTHRRAMVSINKKAGLRVRALFRAIFGRIFLYEKVFVFETLSSKICFITANKGGVNIRLARSDDILKLKRFEKFKGGKAGERLRAGHLCFVAEKDGKIANYTWVCFNEAFISELERKLHVGPNSAYRYDGFTVPEYRGMGILPRVLAWSSDYLFRNGIKDIYDLVTSNNYPSLRAHAKVGSVKMGEVTLIKLFRLRTYKCKGETPQDYVEIRKIFSI